MANFLRLIGFLLVIWSASSHAGTTAHEDQGEAFSVCKAAQAASQSKTYPSGTAGAMYKATGLITKECTLSTTTYVCQAQYRLYNSSGAATGTTGLSGCITLDADDKFTFPTGGTCSSRNATLGEPERVYVGQPPSCVAGCSMSHGATTSTTVNGNTVYGTENTEYSGSTCSAPMDAPPVEKPGPDTPDADEACVPAGNGQTACIKPNGNMCATASTGAQVCWGPTQTGEQVADAGNLQQRVPGLSRPGTPPTTPPPPDAVWNPNNSHQSTSPQNGTFTVVNFSTTPGDGGNTGIDGSGTGGDDGGEEGDPGTATGGGDCAAPPACSGEGENAAIQCAIVQQAWLARCSAKVSGPGIACSSEIPLVCTNMSVHECGLAAANKKAACALEGIEGAIGDDGEGIETADVDPDTAWADGNGGSGDGSGDGFDLDDGGWLSTRSCPTVDSVSVFGKTISFNTETGRVCDFFAVTSALVLLFAGFACARIMGET